MFDRVNFTLRRVVIGLSIAIFSTSAAAESTSGGHAQTHPRTARTHKAPPPHAKVAAKKKRPTVPHKKKAVAKGPKPVTRNKSAQNASHVTRKRHHEPSLLGPKVSPTAAAARPKAVEVDKPRVAKAGNDSPPASGVTAPDPPKAPDVPEVPAPKSPSVD